MQKNPVLPEWFTKLIDKFQLNQSWLTINVNDAPQLSELSQDQIAFFMNMVKLMQTDLPESQLVDEVLSLGPREVEEKVTAIDIVISRTQRVGLQISTINHQVNQNPTQHIQHQTVQIGTQYNFFGVSGFSNASSASLKSDGPFRDCFGLPQAFEDFTGREDSLALLEANAGQSTVISHPKKTVSGTGGIGKTQLALTFAHSKLKHYRETQGKGGYRSIIWFIAGTDEGVDTQGLMMEQMNRLGQQLGFDTKQLNPDALVKLIFQRLSDEYGPYLVVYDNAQNLRSIKHYLPPASVPVIITTRNNIERDWDQTFKAITLSVFSKAEAHAYIKKVLCRNHANLYRQGDADALVKALGYFPLALTQALAYIMTENIEITQYLEEFTQQKAKYLQEPVPQGDPFHEDKNPSSDHYAALPKKEYDPQKATVWSVVQLSLKKVINPEAHQLLKACAYLAPEAPIDMKLLAHWCANMAECREAVGALRRYSLLENVSVAGHVRVHQLVQEIVKLADDDEAREIWLEVVAGFMGEHYTKKESPLVDEAREKALFPHLQAVLGHIEVLKEGPTRLEQIIARLQYFIGNIYLQMSNSIEARRCFQIALKIIERGDDSIALSRVLGSLGSATYNLGDYKGAKALHERTLNIQEQIYGSGHPAFAGTLVSIGNSINGLGDTAGAKALQERALEIQERTYGLKHPALANTLMCLATSAGELGDMARAKELLVRALDIKERTFGSEHSELGMTLMNLGIATRELGDTNGAKTFLERAVAIMERSFGPDSTCVAKALVNLGNANLQSGEFLSAKAQYERALAIQERIFGPNHVEVAITLDNFANSTRAIGDPKGAKALHQRALDILERAFGPEHIKTVGTLANLASVAHEMGDAVSAKAVFERVLGITERAFGHDHPETAQIRYNLAITLDTLGQREAALANFRHCARVYSRHYGGQHPHTRNALAKVHELQEELRQGPLQSSVPAKSSSTKNPLMEFISGILHGEFPPPCQLILHVAWGCFELAMISEAIALLEYVLEMETSLGGLLLRAQCQLERCDVSGASETASLCQALLEENNPEVKALLSKIEKSQLQTKQSQAEIVAFQSQPSLNVKDQIKIAINLQRLNRFDEALRILDTVIASRPSVDILAPAYFNRAICYFRLRRYEEAQKSGEESYRLKEHPNVEGLIKKIKLAIEISPKLKELLDQLTHSSTHTLSQ